MIFSKTTGQSNPDSNLLKALLSSVEMQSFDEIWLVKYQSGQGYLFDGFNAIELRTMKCFVERAPKQHHLPNPFTSYKNALFITDDTESLFEGFSKFGWDYPTNAIDVFIEYQNLPNGIYINEYDYVSSGLATFGTLGNSNVEDQLVKLFDFHPEELTIRDFAWNQMLKMGLLFLHIFDEIEYFDSCLQRNIILITALNTDNQSVSSAKIKYMLSYFYCRVEEMLYEVNAGFYVDSVNFNKSSIQRFLDYFNYDENLDGSSEVSPS